MRYTHRFIPAFAIALSALFLVSCDSEADYLAAIVSSAPTAGRAQTTAALKADFDAERITFEGALIRAEELLEANDPAATLFAGATLDFAIIIEDKFPRGGEFELFWRRLGRLAYNASYTAYEAQRYTEADTLVLAGPKRWQRDPYWRQYPNHEVLVALSLAHQGNASAGINLLNDRLPMPEGHQEAIDSLIDIKRQQLRQRLRQGIESDEPTPGGG